MRKLLAHLLVAALLGAQLAPAHAQRGGREDRGRERVDREQRFKPPSHLSHDERRRLREDVDSARGAYDGRREGRRLQRMAPEDREKLRQDIQDANRDMRRR